LPRQAFRQAGLRAKLGIDSSTRFGGGGNVLVARIRLLSGEAISIFNDEENRRTGYDRRHYSYAVHIPERRSGLDRRRRRGTEKEKTRAFENAQRAHPQQLVAGLASGI